MEHAYTHFEDAGEGALQPDPEHRPPPAPAVRGRGAAENPANRFEALHFEPDPESYDEEPPAPGTQYLLDDSRSILARNDSPDVGFDVSINPYRGCEHGCVYCYARPFHEYLGFSAGLDFETRILVKERAPELLRRELSKPSWKPQLIGISGVTDPYQPVERRLKLTRRCLEVLAEFRNPVGVVTKNHMVTRDRDLLGDLAGRGSAAVFLSLTTLDPELSQRMEPRAASPARRLAALRELRGAGVPCGVLVAPVVPGLTEHELPAILAAAAEAGAAFAGYVLLRLPLAVGPLFEAWLERHYPTKRQRVISKLRAMRAGEVYRSGFGTRMRGAGPGARQIADLFKMGCSRAGLATKAPKLSAADFRVPGLRQNELF